MAAVHPIKIEQGATFQLNFMWEDANHVPVNLTGWTARMQVRRNYKADVPLLTFTTENGAITLGGSAGTVAITGLATLTDDVPAKLCVYDIELQSPTGFVKRILEGTALVTPEVTR